MSRPAVTKIEDAYRLRTGPPRRPSYVPNYEDAKRILEALEREEVSRSSGRLARKATEVAHAPVISVRAHDSLGKAMDIMKSHNYSQLPVLEGGYPIGRITEGQILDAILGDRSSLVRELCVREVMGDPFPSVGASIMVRSIVPLIKEGRAVLVVDNRGTLVGIVTAFDLLG